MNDQIDGAAAYKPTRSDDVANNRRDFRTPVNLRLTKDRDLKLDYRQTAIAAGALGLGYLAYRAVSAWFGKPAETDRLEATPLSQSASPDVKDNAAPRFAGEGISTAPAAPFVAASGADDTGDLVVEVTEVEVVEVTSTGASADRSARTPEHVPTDLMGANAPGSRDRAIDAFRPDATAPVPPEMRDSLRPATSSAPSFAANRGDFASGLSQTDGSK